jgi:hypothetical protein
MWGACAGKPGSRFDHSIIGKKDAVYTIEIPGSTGCWRNIANDFQLLAIRDPTGEEYDKSV